MPVASPDALTWRCRYRILHLNGRPLIMGILNVTPDSFSDGGRFTDLEAAVAHGMRVHDGAIIDYGEPPARVCACTGRNRKRASAGAPRLAPDRLPAFSGYYQGRRRPALDAGAHIINDIPP